MSDRRLRELERRWNESGSAEDRKVYDRERVRRGLEKLPREFIRHYIKPEDHGVCGPDGKIDRELNVTVGFTGYHGVVGGGRTAEAVASSCNVELWPRNLYAKARGRDQTMKKDIHYTEDEDEVTCKRCIGSINKLPDGVRRRKHYAPGSKVAVRRVGFSEHEVAPVCGRRDSDKFEESFSYTMMDVSCPACKRIMAMGRRKSRRPSRAL